MKRYIFYSIFYLLSSSNLFSATPTEQFVFNKLYQEYSECTVYYKFIARGVEKRGELTNEQKKFMNKAISLSEESEKNMFFFAQELKISNDNVQTNVEKIYKSFLEKVGYDYSNSELLVDYAKKCINSLSDPKMRMVYWENVYNNELKKENLIKIFGIILFILFIFIIFIIFKKKKKSISSERNLSRKIMQNIKKNKTKSKIKPILKTKDSKKNIMFDQMKENSKTAGKLNSILLGVIRHQLSITVKGLDYFKKNKDPLKTLPRDNFVYGYLYGFVDYCYQTSGKIADEESWLIGSLAFFGMVFGAELGAKICMDSEKLLSSSNEFNRGVKLGSDDARKFKNKKTITALADYINSLQ